MAVTNVTADTITDDQIRELRREKAIDATTYHTALWGSWLKQDARARCASILNARRKHAAKKSPQQLDAEIAEALASPSTARQPLRVPLSKGLGQAIRRHSGTAVFTAITNTSRGYVFESADPGVVRAFWYATNEVLHRPATRAIGDAVVKLRTDLRPIIEASWPEAIAR